MLAAGTEHLHLVLKMGWPLQWDGGGNDDDNNDDNNNNKDASSAHALQWGHWLL